MEDTRTIPAGIAPAEFKAQYNRVHTEKQAASRYAINGHVVRTAVESIEADIRGKDRALYAVKVESEWLPIVYDLATKSPVTILPAHSLRQYHDFLNPKKTFVEAEFSVPEVSLDLPATHEETSLAYKECVAKLHECEQAIGKMRGEGFTKQREAMRKSILDLVELKSRLKLHRSSIAVFREPDEFGDDSELLLKRLYAQAKIMTSVLKPADGSEISDLMKSVKSYLEKCNGA